MSEPTAEETRRFWRKVKYLEDGCWEWAGARSGSGYGHAWIGGRWERAHRVSFAIWFGPIPDGVLVCHTCDNPPCVRPDHLFAGTDADNLADMRAKGRQATGERHQWYGQDQSCEANHYARLTAENVADARAMVIAGYDDREIAERFGVNRATITYVRQEKTWKGIAPSPPLPAVQRISYAAKLGPETAQAIRSRYTGRRGELTQIAAEFGVSRPAVRAIISGRSYPGA